MLLLRINVVFYSKVLYIMNISNNLCKCCFAQPHACIDFGKTIMGDRC